MGTPGSGRHQQCVDGVVAGGEFNALGGGTGGEECGDGVGFAAALPISIDAGFDGQLERGTAAKVGVVDVGAAGDELADDVVPGAPGGVVEGGGVLRRIEVGIPFVPGRVGGDAE